MKIWCLWIFTIISFLLLSPPARATAPYFCSNEASSLAMELSFDVVHVYDKHTYKVEKVLRRVWRPAAQRGAPDLATAKFKSEGGDWQLEEKFSGAGTHELWLLRARNAKASTRFTCVQ